MSGDLLQTKLYMPRVRPFLIPRPHLIKKLNRGLQRKLTLISAPAGFGKTTLLANWLSDVDRPSVWVSLDEDDNDLVQFFTYAAAAVQQVKGVGNKIQGVLQSPQPAPLKSLATALINDCTTVTTPFILALDDYHMITETAVHEAVTFLLDNLPPQLHLVITSRTDPLLPLPRLRAHGQMTELRTGDLRFTAEETAAFIQQFMGLNLTVKQVVALETRTEGWIAGLQMAALSIQGMSRAAEITTFIADFTGSNRYIFDYLTDEVLAQRPPETKSFLLQTAVLDRFNADLCTAVTGNPNSQSILHTLESANLFLFPLDNNRQWYRYHPLFVDLLQHRLLQRPKQERDKLHRRAANWFEAKKNIDRAIKHYQEADDQANIARLIKQYGSETLQPGQLNRLQRWLNALSPEQVQADAWLAMLQAWIYYFEQKTEQVAIWVEHARHQLESAGNLPQEDDTQLRGSLVGLHSWLAGQQGDFEQAFQLAEKALAILPETDPVWRGIVYVFLGLALFGEGRTAEAIAAYENSLQFNNEAGNWVATSAISDAIMMTITFRGRQKEAKAQYDRIIATLMRLGQTRNAANLRLARLSILYEQNDLAAMGPELSELQTLAQNDGGIEAIRYQYLLAVFHKAIGDQEKALQLLQQMEQGISFWTTPDELARAVASIMRIYLRLGNRQKPLKWLKSITIDQNNLTLLRMSEYLAKADILRFSDSREAQLDGLELIEAVHKLCDDVGMVGFKIDVYCLQALLMVALDDEEAAFVSLEHALALAEPESYVRTFVDFGQPMARLLKKAISHNIHSQYARFLLTQFLPDTETRIISQTQQNIMEPLSTRELDVLTFLASHLTGPEIADQLNISNNTLKTHTRNIYSKLGVNGRNQAVVRAKGLGLL